MSAESVSVKTMTKIDSKFKVLYKNVQITPKNSAVVLIDIWEDKFLDDFVKLKVNHFIKKMANKGFTIIYAPSQNKMNKHLVKVNGHTLYNLDSMSSILEQKKIKNIFYIGFDTLLCVFDKPNGVFHFKNNNHKYNIFMIQDLLVSYTKEMKDFALNVLMKNGYNIINSKELYKVFKEENNEDLIFKYPKTTNYHLTNQFLSGGNPLVLIYGTMDNLKSKLKKDNIRYLEVIDNKIILDSKKIIIDTITFVNYLIQNNITDLIYSGYYINQNILYGKFGILQLYIKERYKRIKLPKRFILRNFNYINPSSNMTVETERAVIVNHYRNINLINLNAIINQKINIKQIYNIKAIVFSLILLSIFLIILILMKRRK